MKIVVTGGGSGGHTTPLLAVAHELKQQADVSIVYIGQRGDRFADIVSRESLIDQRYSVRAGKFRRYHGEGWRQLFDIPTLLKNIRDAVFVLIGIWQSFWLLRKLRPDAVFIKGGFVGVPVGLAAAALRIPYVTHDSDALPGLANRIVAPWAKVHAVALPKEVYAYSPDKTITVGVPLMHHYQPVTAKMQRAFRTQLELPATGKMLLVTGGGQGAQRLNEAVSACVPDLLARYHDLTVVIIAGHHHETSMRRHFQNELPADDAARVVVRGFVGNLHVYSGAADVILTRAGATSIAEFAAQAKACVVVPNPVLTGGHQLKNAQVLATRKAIRVIPNDVLQTDPLALMAPLVDLLDHPEMRERLGKKLATLAQPDAAERLAMLLLEVASGKTPKL